jgi:hypothetical protein
MNAWEELPGCLPANRHLNALVHSRSANFLTTKDTKSTKNF